MKSLRELYGLSYDTSGINSGLINWYNRVIDKQYSSLDASDVCRMLRQDILKGVATKRAIDLFLTDPYDGENCDGELLSVLVALDLDTQKLSRIDELKTALHNVKIECEEYAWEDKELRNQYAENINKFLKHIDDSSI